MQTIGHPLRARDRAGWLQDRRLPAPYVWLQPYLFFLRNSEFPNRSGAWLEISSSRGMMVFNRCCFLYERRLPSVHANVWSGGG
jgi:hypothetical protein